MPLVNWKGESDDPSMLEYLQGEEVAAAFLREDLGRDGANALVIVMKSGAALMLKAPRGDLGTPSMGVVPPDALVDFIRGHRAHVAEKRERLLAVERRHAASSAQIDALPEWMR